MKLKISLLLLTFIGFSFTSSEKNKTFDISGKYENGILYLTCNQGCDWDILELTPGKKQIFVNAFGSSGVQFPEVNKARYSDFHFSVIKTENKLQFKRINGLNWLSVAAGCSNTCNFELNNDGIEVSNKG